jgi:hypothetical protein
MSYEILIDGCWQVPDKVNDHSRDGWVGYKIGKRLGVALEGQWRVKRGDVNVAGGLLMLWTGDGSMQIFALNAVKSY